MLKPIPPVSGYEQPSPYSCCISAGQGLCVCPYGSLRVDMVLSSASSRVKNKQSIISRKAHSELWRCIPVLHVFGKTATGSACVSIQRHTHTPLNSRQVIAASQKLPLFHICTQAAPPQGALVPLPGQSDPARVLALCSVALLSSVHRLPKEI